MLMSLRKIAISRPTHSVGCRTRFYRVLPPQRGGRHPPGFLQAATGRAAPEQAGRGAFPSISTRWRANTEPLSSYRQVGGPPEGRRNIRSSSLLQPPSQDAGLRSPEPGLSLGLPPERRSLTENPNPPPLSGLLNPYPLSCCRQADGHMGENLPAFS